MGLGACALFWAGGAALFYGGWPLVGWVTHAVLAMSFFAMEALSGSERALHAIHQRRIPRIMGPEVVEQNYLGSAKMTSLEWRASGGP